MTVRQPILWAILAAILVLSPACSSLRGGDNADSENNRGGLRIPSFGGGGSNEVAGIGVNSYLWRASLDTISFMPLQEVDPFGGVIITDWYANPELPSERFKVTVYILDTRLRADALSVRVFRQESQGSGNWVDVTVSPETAVEIENAILTRARQLRISNLESE
ncbi:DUF3576 domain-containing protein [Maricaulis sp.]|jgi:hypothetical protein|uniref:DUF3576 domain-containing protein n=1 Tax=Maricaulis sp. TaxID=1486257 RepID=UPI000C5069E5|nr:DUF3576 domain-containing protein [Maricaulis sp.]MAL08145.1 hypothetical protein [Maricaulis sp.]HAQ34950.1 DUF3576 domain-containing protein [Alphaproteobacteria bacterium]|tara:strand:- start:50 stop:541 length:492 start_codon:yes stop_codon:yes gene_type:complete